MRRKIGGTTSVVIEDGIDVNLKMFSSKNQAVHLSEMYTRWHADQVDWKTGDNIKISIGNVARDSLHLKDSGSDATFEF